MRANLMQVPCTDDSYAFDVVAEYTDVTSTASNRVRVIMDIIRNEHNPVINNLPANITIGTCPMLNSMNKKDLFSNDSLLCMYMYLRNVLCLFNIKYIINWYKDFAK